MLVPHRRQRGLLAAALLAIVAARSTAHNGMDDGAERQQPSTDDGAALPALASALPSGLAPDELRALRGLRKNVLESEYAGQFVKNRTFGVNGTGQETVFLQEQLDGALPELRVKLRGLAHRLDGQAGWGVLPDAGGSKGRALTMRCVELLRYNGGSSGTEGVGWHTVRSIIPYFDTPSRCLCMGMRRNPDLLPLSVSDTSATH